MLKGIIFDFDGVIAESIDIKTNAFAEIYNEYGSNVVEKVIKHHNEHGGISRYEKFRYYHETFLKKTLKEREVLSLANQFSKLIIDKVIDAPYVPGVLNFIIDNYKRYKLFISTGTPSHEIKQILTGRDILHYFIKVYGSPDKKENHIMEISNKYKIEFNEMVFIGDAKTDLDAAKKFGVKFLLRLHENNQIYYKNYTGQKINDFTSLQTEMLI